jgi:hypothetical protein
MTFPIVPESSAKRPEDVREYAAACPERPQAAGLVPYKTSGPTGGPLEVSFDPEVVMARRVSHLRRHVWACGHLHSLGGTLGGKREVVWFVTLTYRGVNDWNRRHISDCLKRVRKWCSRQGVSFRYVWVAELQMRGAMHYHLAIWLPKRLRLPQFDKQRWWTHGMTQTVVGRSPVGYLMKYLSKMNARQRFPRGARIYGSGGLATYARSICAWYRLPYWCKQRFGVGELRTISGRRVVRETGEILAPMYTRIRRPSGMYLLPNGPIPDEWASGPYSTVKLRGVAGESH